MIYLRARLTLANYDAKRIRDGEKMLQTLGGLRSAGIISVATSQAKNLI